MCTYSSVIIVLILTKVIFAESKICNFLWVKLLLISMSSALDDNKKPKGITLFSLKHFNFRY